MYNSINDLVGKTCSSVIKVDDEIHFHIDDDQGLRKHCALLHHQDCCESVSIESIDGDLEDLVGAPLIMAEEASSEGVEPIEGSLDLFTAESCTWTFYKFATQKGYVTIRWYGTSNGYYSESVSFEVYD